MSIDEREDAEETYAYCLRRYGVDAPETIKARTWLTLLEDGRDAEAWKVSRDNNGRMEG